MTSSTPREMATMKVRVRMTLYWVTEVISRIKNSGKKALKTTQMPNRREGSRICLLEFVPHLFESKLLDPKTLTPAPGPKKSYYTFSSRHKKTDEPNHSSMLTTQKRCYTKCKIGIAFAC